MTFTRVQGFQLTVDINNCDSRDINKRRVQKTVGHIKVKVQENISMPSFASILEFLNVKTKMEVQITVNTKKKHKMQNTVYTKDL